MESGDWVDVDVERLSADVNAVEVFKITLKSLIKAGGFEEDLIYNVDESGLYWKTLPKKTLASKKSCS